MVRSTWARLALVGPPWMVPDAARRWRTNPGGHDDEPDNDQLRDEQ